ncbi:hypothetical protein D9613_006957 [Agrocybe pediades]|uniref:Uncharacterized protein n=1 Tax=Agrocybe pediades TaxID=84607 RepID=A0A8H4QH32_9AGAR|nr:hypothetical protein D9613_006957 [Agrocybe pediades]
MPMPRYEADAEIFASNSHLLAPSGSSRKSASRQTLGARRSAASLRASSNLALDLDLEDDGAGGRHHSLAHELAVALMPEPSAGSKLLAEEFGIEFDEGAEGIDEMADQHEEPIGVDIHIADVDVPSFASELAASGDDVPFQDLPPEEPENAESLGDHGFDPVFSSSTSSKARQSSPKPAQDPMDVLAQDLKSTEVFVGHLQQLDIEPKPSTSHQPTLERLASDVIRRMDVTIRDRESHVRELQEYERELKKIAGEVGGEEILSRLEELPPVEDLSDTPFRPEPSRTNSRHLDFNDEEPRSPGVHNSMASDWELDPDKHHLGDEDEYVTSPIKDSFTYTPLVNGPPTPATTVSELKQLRSATTSLVSSLTIISEQAQVNGAATSEAGRKIRALKNKLGGWRTDWDSAERSRQKIEKWESGWLDGDEPGTPTSSSSRSSRRVDGRKIVEEHLRAFELALAEAAIKTQAIMAR